LVSTSHPKPGRARILDFPVIGRLKYGQNAQA
jgi:hypothetical protein